ncbi:hypothetical protein CSW98_05860 [Vibrio sp. HA2012]|uniref:tyrosine-type recombinase/integrase n=1 Tax=Vibrio sp. HA2012 TaxID=1971595 RepID=UPI000C2C1304|nr:tyrosine-type recombinase/integrase [Vibrio sp. HA2012]PJC87421.1 hypothetical protein CSW98_05860 [Vibrio sp. HA2012]
MKKNIPPINNIHIRKASVNLFSRAILCSDINQLTHGQYSKSSILAMTSDWNNFISFCEAKHVSPLPASITAVRLFLETEAKKRKLATIKRYSVTIGTIHQLHSLPDPTAHRQIRFTLQAIRMDKHGDARQANAFTHQHLHELNRLMNKESSVKSHRDLAIYYVMFECALKRADLRDLQFTALDKSNNQIMITIGTATYKLSHEASYIFNQWLKYIPEQSGSVFRRIDRHGNIGFEALDDSSIYRISRQASDILGLSTEMRFTGQSARVGAAKELEQQGYDLKSIQEFGRWLCPVMPAQYLGKQNTAELEKAKFRIIKPWE